MHVIRSRAREYASHATVAGVISSALDLIWIGMCDVGRYVTPKPNRLHDRAGTGAFRARARSTF